jgi:hypothetical protein
VKKSVGNNVKEALYNVPLFFTFPQTSFFKPFSSIVEMPDNEDGHVNSYSPVLIWVTISTFSVFFIDLTSGW